MAAAQHIWETRSDGKTHDIVTLHTRTTTNAARALAHHHLQASAHAAWRIAAGQAATEKNEGKARARAVCRLNPIDHEKYKEAERARKRAAVLATAWMTPVLWQPCEASGFSAEISRIGRPGEHVNEHVQMTPSGSRLQSFKHTSPGGTVRLEDYTSPADVRASRVQRRGWRSRIANARMEMRMEGRVICYWTECMHCGISRRIQPDGCMPQHSIGPSLSKRERAAYRESEAYAEHGWDGARAAARTMAHGVWRVMRVRMKATKLMSNL